MATATNDRVECVTDEVLRDGGLSMAQAAALLPPGPKGAVAASTVYKWIRDGARAGDGSMVKLEAARIGASWRTSRAALRRFIDRLSGRETGSEGKEVAATAAA